MSRSIQGKTPRGISYSGVIIQKGDRAIFSLALEYQCLVTTYRKSFDWVLNKTELESVLDEGG